MIGRQIDDDGAGMDRVDRLDPWACEAIGQGQEPGVDRDDARGVFGELVVIERLEREVEIDVRQDVPDMEAGVLARGGEDDGQFRVLGQERQELGADVPARADECDGARGARAAWALGALGIGARALGHWGPSSEGSAMA
jgi:hypothetical protein